MADDVLVNKAAVIERCVARVRSGAARPHPPRRKGSAVL